MFDELDPSTEGQPLDRRILQEACFIKCECLPGKLTQLAGLLSHVERSGFFHTHDEFLTFKDIREGVTERPKHYWSKKLSLVKEDGHRIKSTLHFVKEKGKSLIPEEVKDISKSAYAKTNSMIPQEVKDSYHKAKEKTSTTTSTLHEIVAKAAHVLPWPSSQPEETKAISKTEVDGEKV
jgi:hypothetical protein